MKKERKRWLRYVLIAVVILAVAIVVLSRTLGRDFFTSAVEVRVHRVARRDLENRITGNGFFTPRRSLTITARVAGEVETIDVSEGDGVEEGQTLMTLNDDAYRLAYEQAESTLALAETTVLRSLVTLRAAYRSALTTLEQARRLFERNTELFSEKAISEENYQKSSDAHSSAQAAHQSAREQLNLRYRQPLEAEPELSAEKDRPVVASSPEVLQAKLSLRAAENELKKARIIAPLAGTITSIPVARGDFVVSFNPVARIESLDDMLAEVQIDEVDIGEVRLEQRVEIASDSLLGEVLGGRVIEVSPIVANLGSTRVGTVKIEIDETSLPLKAGASCTARIVTNLKRGTPAIPLSAFIEESNSSFVYVLEPVADRREREHFRLSKREISTGLSNVSYVEVISGLEPGDAIVEGNLRLLRDGLLVVPLGETDD
jgi:HlyD family secretion protein